MSSARDYLSLFFKLRFCRCDIQGDWESRFRTVGQADAA